MDAEVLYSAPGVMFGWYSAKQAEYSELRYKTVTGAVVEVTEVSEGPKPSSQWEDIKFVAMVTECVQPLPADCYDEMDDADEWDDHAPYWDDRE